MESWLPALLQTSDSIFPTGGYAHSLGLEEMASLGIVKDAATLASFLDGHIVPMLANFELPYVRYADTALRAGDIETLAVLDGEIGAMKLCREPRAASVQMGTQRLRMLARLHAENQTLAAHREMVDSGRARAHASIVWAMQAFVLGVPLEAALAGYYYQTLAGFCVAALKLVRIGQEACQIVLGGRLRQAPGVIARAQTITREDAGWFDPMLDIACARHERAFARLFIS